MTTLLGYHAPNGAIYIAADRRATANSTDIVSDTNEKVLKAGRWTVAFCGGQAAFDALDRSRDDLGAVEDYRQLPRLFKSVMEREGFVLASTGGEKARADSSFLVSDGVGLWKMFCDFGMTRIEPGCLTKNGSGGDFALGAAAVLTALPGADPDRALREAIRVAIRFDCASGGEPEVVLCLPLEKET